MLYRKFLDYAQNTGGQLRIECARGFVKEQHLGVHGQSASDAHALLLTARKLTGHLVLATLEPHLRDKLAGALLNLGGRAFLHAHRRVRDVAHNGIVREEIVVLKHQAKAATSLFEHVALGIDRLA